MDTTRSQRSPVRERIDAALARADTTFATEVKAELAEGGTVMSAHRRIEAITGERYAWRSTYDWWADLQDLP